jgi:hypothetical protein
MRCEGVFCRNLLYLKRARWDLETLSGDTGGCLSYPPPKLTAAVGGNVEIDLSPLGMKVK